jgi:hypothetical protein
MQVPPDGRIPLDRAIQILSFKKASSKKDLDRISRILDPGSVGSIPPSQLVRIDVKWIISVEVLITQ